MQIMALYPYDITSKTLLLCCIMACFHVISMSLMCDGDNPSAHYLL